MAPSEAGIESVTAGLFGKIAETTISRHYLKHRGKAHFFPLSDTDFEDIIAGWRNIELYITFLKMKNPQLSVSQLLDMRKSLKSEKGSLLKIPDLLTHDGGLREFYEIKPNTPDEIDKGVTKLTRIKAFLDSFGLRSYKGGTTWQPDTKLKLFEGRLPEIVPNVLVNIKVFFHFKWLPPGLIVYEVCVELDLALEEMAIRAIAAAIILVIVFGPEILAGIVAGLPELVPVLVGGGALIPRFAR